MLFLGLTTQLFSNGFLLDNFQLVPSQDFCNNFLNASRNCRLSLFRSTAVPTDLGTANAKQGNFVCSRR